jgi:hypothetical protein
LARFGRDVPRIAAAFKAAEQRFPPGKAPIGPVGAHVKLKEAKWGGAICDVIGRGGRTWLVHAYKDIEVCKAILREKRIGTEDAQFHTINPDHFDAKVGRAAAAPLLSSHLISATARI